MKNLPEKFMQELRKDRHVVALILFGSLARKEKNRDIDLCLVLDKKHQNIKMSKIKLKYSSLVPSKYDVKIFQQLPTYIRKRILKEGKILLCKDEDFLYSLAFQTIKEFEFYKKIYHTYLKTIEND